MKYIKTELKGVLLIEPTSFGDRGWFMETYSAARFKDVGIELEFVQDN